MNFTEKQEYKIEILENGTLQIRRSDVVCKGDVEVGRKYHRYVLQPGDPVDTQIQRIKAVAAAVWTSEVLTAHQSQVSTYQALSTTTEEYNDSEIE